jgi:hypothetical protein
MRSMIVVAALAGGIWYSAPDLETTEHVALSVETQAPADKWLVSGAGSTGANCYMTLESSAKEAPRNVLLSPGCTGASPVAQASNWWENGDGNLVLASAQGEKIAEFSADETEGLVSVWPRHTIVTLTPAN